MLSRLVYKSLEFLDAERSHNIAKWGMKRRFCAPGVFAPPELASTMWGTTLPNPLGLAAGFDKNGELVDVIQNYGFGFVEVGSVTSRGGKGNPRPRMFRLEDNDIMNRMGLNGDPACQVAERLTKCKNQAFGVNIAKTHDPQILGDAAIRDMLDSYKLLNALGMYTTINVSCPNTAEGKTFEQPEPLRELLSALKPHRNSPGARPMLVKLSPVFFGEQDRFISVLDICEEFGVNGYVISNTMPFTHPKFGKGGRSGAAVIHSAKILTVVARKHLKHRQIHGVGGVFTANDMYTYECAGANFVQVYNGFVHGPLAGTDFVPRLLTGFLAIKKRMSEDKNTLSPAQKRINAMLDGDAT